MEFPLIKIHSKDYLDEEELIPLFDEYIYSSKEKVFHDYYFNKEFADCKGNIYKVVDKRLPTSFWRGFLRFLPGVYKVKLIFRSTNKQIELEELKEDLIAGIRRFDTQDTVEITEKWIKEIKSSNSIKAILTAEM
jgi:hypothetical protein